MENSPRCPLSSPSEKHTHTHKYTHTWRGRTFMGSSSSCLPPVGRQIANVAADGKCFT